MMDNYNKWGTVNYVIADDTFNDRDIQDRKTSKCLPAIIPI